MAYTTVLSVVVEPGGSCIRQSSSVHGLLGIMVANYRFGPNSCLATSTLVLKYKKSQQKVNYS